MVSIDNEHEEIECPICDQKIPSNARKCPGCGTDFQMLGIEDLEAVINDLSERKDEKKAVAVVVQKEEKPFEKVEPEEQTKDKKGGLSTRPPFLGPNQPSAIGKRAKRVGISIAIVAIMLTGLALLLASPYAIGASNATYHIDHTDQGPEIFNTTVAVNNIGIVSQHVCITLNVTTIYGSVDVTTWGDVAAGQSRDFTLTTAADGDGQYRDGEWRADIYVGDAFVCSFGTYKG